MGNEESGMFEEDGEVGQLPSAAAAKGGRRGAAADTTSGGSTSSNYGDYPAPSSSNRRGGRRGHAGGSSGNENYGSSAPSADKYSSPSVNTHNSPSSSSAKAKGGGDDMFGELNLPLGETPKSISDKGRKAFNQAIWSPRGGKPKPKSQDPQVTDNNSKEPQMKPIGETNTEKSSPTDKKTKFNFDSLYFNQSKSTTENKTPKKSEMDDDLFSNPFGVSSGVKQKETKSRSINVDVKMGNSKLKQKVRNDRRQKEQQRHKTTFHKPKSDIMYDAFDDLEEEMIGDGVIGNGNKAGGNTQRKSSIAKPKQLQWNTGQSSRGEAIMEYGSPSSNGSGSNRSNANRGGGGDDGWF